jgi:hypothetical protein
VLALVAAQPRQAGARRQPGQGLAELSVLKERQFGDDVGTARRLVWVGERYRDYAYGR